MAIFVDAAGRCASSGVRIEQVVPLDEGAVSLVHGITPRSLLRLSLSLFGRSPTCWMVSIPAEDFSYGEGLSPLASEGVRAALDAVAALLDPRTEPNPIRSSPCPPGCSRPSPSPAPGPGIRPCAPASSRLTRSRIARSPATPPRSACSTARAPDRWMQDVARRDEPLRDRLRLSRRSPGRRLQAALVHPELSRSTSAATRRWPRPTSCGRRALVAGEKPALFETRSGLPHRDATGRLDRARFPGRAAWTPRRRPRRAGRARFGRQQSGRLRRPQPLRPPGRARRRAGRARPPPRHPAGGVVPGSRA